MAAEVELDLERFDALFDAAAMEAAQDAMSRRWREFMEPYVPKDHGWDGGLVSQVEVDGQKITYTKDYAVYVYNMDENVNWTIKGTGPHWNELAKSEHLGDLARYVGECILGGGR